ncbi:MAG: type II toxin-antitoxin system VapC family toxin [Thermoanaerobaculia bacterium]
MRFWDSSALVPLLVEEPATDRLLALYRDDTEVAVWWATPVECASAIARLEREGDLAAEDATAAFQRLDALAPSWIEVEPGEELREIARRLLRVHPLRAVDSLQLAAALVAAERRPSTLDLVTLDDRLQQAADREGFLRSS